MKKENLPFVYGNIDVQEFLKLKKIIDKSILILIKSKIYIILNPKDGI